jgi:hypothetical protein
MTSSKNFKITITTPRNRKSTPTPTNDVDKLQDQLCEILGNPLIDRIPGSEVFRSVIGYAIKDLARA